MYRATRRDWLVLDGVSSSRSPANMIKSPAEIALTNQWRIFECYYATFVPADALLHKNSRRRFVKHTMSGRNDRFVCDQWTTTSESSTRRNTLICTNSHRYLNGYIFIYKNQTHKLLNLYMMPCIIHERRLSANDFRFIDNSLTICVDFILDEK